MILLLDTSSSVCRLTLIVGDQTYETEWQAERELAKGLLGFLESELNKRDETFRDLTGLGAFMGPGSFTGLRIGLTVLNTLADSLNIPIVGETGDDWKEQAIARLNDGQNDQVVLPHYGSEARITSPRK